MPPEAAANTEAEAHTAAGAAADTEAEVAGVAEPAATAAVEVAVGVRIAARIAAAVAREPVGLPADHRVEVPELEAPRRRPLQLPSPAPRSKGSLSSKAERRARIAGKSS
jgi:hypothetical protein